MSHSRNSELEARIVIEKRRDGKRTIFCYCPQTNRQIRTGHHCWPSEVEKTVRDIQRILLRAGNRVTVVDKTRD